MTPLRLLAAALLWPIWLYAEGGQIELACGQLQTAKNFFIAQHVTLPALTQELERRTLDQFFKRLDPDKIDLLESDVKLIRESMTRIFSKVAGQNCAPLTSAHELFLRRLDERMKAVSAYLGPDFKPDTRLRYETNSEKRRRARTSGELSRAVRDRIQYEVANYINSGIGLEKAKQHVLKNHERWAKRIRNLKSKDVFGAYLNDFAKALDPHSDYMPAEAHEDFEIQMSLALEGIGASLSWKNGFTIVEELLPGGAAAKSGLVKKRDKIIAVAQGQDGPFTDVIEMEIREVIKLIRGKKGTTVRLQFLRRAGATNQIVNVTLVRDKINLEDQAAFIRYSEQSLDGRKVKVAFLNLPSFYDDQKPGGRSAMADLRKLIGEAKASGAEALVLDLSGNGGGSLQDAVAVAGLFIGQGPVVKVIGRGDAEQTLSDEDPDVAWAGPLVLLTSRVSASASEIVAGVLKDYYRALVVGADHTYGKGTVQAITKLLPGLGAIKTTTALFFTAGGASTQHRGVSSDIVFPSILAKQDIGERFLVNSLPGRRIQPFTSGSAYVMTGPNTWSPLNQLTRDKIKALSERRMRASEGFKKIRSDIAKFKKPSTVVSIAQLLKGKDLDAKTDERDDDPDAQPLTREDRIKKYMERVEVQEAMKVAADLAHSL